MTIKSNWRLLWLMTDLKISLHFFNQWEPKAKSIAPCTRDFSRTLRKLQVAARNSDWFIMLFALVMTGRSDYFGIGFSTVIWEAL